MTREEYLQLVNNSEVYKKLNEEIRKRIIDANEEQMAAYVKMLTDAQSVLDHAKEELVESNAKVIKDLESNIKKIKKDKLKSDEVRAEKADAKKGEELLGELENI